MFTHSSQLRPVIQFLIELYVHNNDLKDKIKELNLKFNCVDNQNSITVYFNWINQSEISEDYFILLHSDKAYKIDDYMSEVLERAFKSFLNQN